MGWERGRGMERKTEREREGGEREGENGGQVEMGGGREWRRRVKFSAYLVFEELLPFISDQ